MSEHALNLFFKMWFAHKNVSNFSRMLFYFIFHREYFAICFFFIFYAYFRYIKPLAKNIIKKNHWVHKINHIFIVFCPRKRVCFYNFYENIYSTNFNKTLLLFVSQSLYSYISLLYHVFTSKFFTWIQTFKIN